MNLDFSLIPSAYAQAAVAAPESNLLMQIAPMVVIFLIFYFLMIRPQMKQAKEHRKLVEALSKGDEVIVNGGMVGRVMQVNEDFISLEIAEGVVVKVQRQAVSTLLPKGTMKKS